MATLKDDKAKKRNKQKTNEHNATIVCIRRICIAMPQNQY